MIACQNPPFVSGPINRRCGIPSSRGALSAKMDGLMAQAVMQVKAGT
jgi:hypothetical protein